MRQPTAIPSGIVVRKAVSRSTDAAIAAREVHDALSGPDSALTILYCAPTYDLDVLGREIQRLFGETPVVGCTTAGEIGPDGYLEGSVSYTHLTLPTTERV